MKNLPKRQVPFCRVVCDGDELKLLKEVLDSGWLTTGPKTALFEERFADAVNAKHALAVNSGTAALHLALEAIGVGPGDKVFVPTMTFTATAEVVRYLGADPIFLDIEYGTGLVTPEILSLAIERHPGAKAFMPVHFAGQPCQMFGDEKTKGLLEICRENGIWVIEDAAHAFPARCGDKMIGSIGDATCFSFYANKTITTGEGGMVTTDNDTIASRIRTMRLHGIDRDVWKRYSETGASWEYDVVAPGYKYNMPDTSAAIGLAQLDKAWSMRDKRQLCAQFYYQALSGIEFLDLPMTMIPMEDHAWHLFVVILNDRSFISRNEFIKKLNAAGIGTSVHFKPLHQLSYYRDHYRLSSHDFHAAERFWNGNVSLPLYPTISNIDLDYVCNILLAINDI